MGLRVLVSGFSVECLVFRVQVSGFRVQGAGFWVQGSGFRVQGSGFRVQGSGFRIQGAGIRVQGSGFRVQGSGFRVQGAGFRVQDSGLRVEGSGVRVQGPGFGRVRLLRAPSHPPWEIAQILGWSHLRQIVGLICLSPRAGRLEPFISLEPFIWPGDASVLLAGSTRHGRWRKVWAGA